MDILIKTLRLKISGEPNAFDKGTFKRVFSATRFSYHREKGGNLKRTRRNGKDASTWVVLYFAAKSSGPYGTATSQKPRSAVQWT